MIESELPTETEPYFNSVSLENLCPHFGESTVNNVYCIDEITTGNYSMNTTFFIVAIVYIVGCLILLNGYIWITRYPFDGYKAYLSGVKKNECPWFRFLPQFKIWLIEWHEAERIINGE